MTSDIPKAPVFVTLALGLACLCAGALANDMPIREVRESEEVRASIASALAARIPGSRVELSSDIRWTRGDGAASGGTVSILNTTSRGEAQFVVRSKTGIPSGEGWVTYRAFLPARIAAKKILPGERLAASSVTTQEVDVASGYAYEYRGVVLSVEGSLDQLESRQTFVEGQLLTSSGVQRVPDIRKGDTVRIRIRSGDLSVTTLGSAEEPGYVGGRVRVLSIKGKREFVGMLENQGWVEVSL